MSRLVCAGCGAQPDPADPYPFRCPNAGRDDDVDHCAPRVWFEHSGTNVLTLERMEGGVATPRGFRASGQYVGIKAAGRGLDLALIVSDTPATAAVA